MKVTALHIMPEVLVHPVVAAMLVRFM